MRVLVVDDSAFMRKVIREMISSDDMLEVIDIARDGVEGVEKAIQLKPDLITMDIEMPRKNGIDALREIMIRCKDHKPAVLMCSSLTVDGSTEALKALRIGAVDFIAKDPKVVGKHDPEFQKLLLEKLRAIGGHRKRIKSKRTSPSKNASAPAPASDPSIPMKSLITKMRDWEMPKDIEIVVIGSSTGGPPVLESVLSGLPKNIRVPIVVAQHMPELFTRSLTSRLDNHCACGAELATHGTAIDDTKIFIAQGGMHIKPTRVAGQKLIARMVENVPNAPYKPSVDLLFSTIADLYGPKVLAIQLTGMGEDGAIGAKAIRDKGGHVIAQEENSCAVFGMPRAVIENGSAHAVFTPKDIKTVLARVCKPTRTGGLDAQSTDRKIA